MTCRAPIGRGAARGGSRPLRAARARRSSASHRSCAPTSSAASPCAASNVGQEARAATSQNDTLRQIEHQLLAACVLGRAASPGATADRSRPRPACRANTSTTRPSRCSIDRRAADRQCASQLSKRCRSLAGCHARMPASIRTAALQIGRRGRRDLRQLRLAVRHWRPWPGRHRRTSRTSRASIAGVPAKYRNCVAVRRFGTALQHRPSSAPRRDWPPTEGRNCGAGPVRPR